MKGDLPEPPPTRSPGMSSYKALLTLVCFKRSRHRIFAAPNEGADATVTLEAKISRTRFRHPRSSAASRRRVACMRQVSIVGFLVAGTVAFFPVVAAAASVSPSPTPSPTTASPTPSPTTASPSPSPTPTSPTTSPSPTPTQTPSPAPTPTPSSKPSPTDSRTPTLPSRAPVRTPAPIPVPAAPVTHSLASAYEKKRHPPAAISAPTTTRARARAAAPPAADVGGAGHADATDFARVAAFAALLAGFAVVAGGWLRLRLRRRAHPPKHAHRTIRPRADDHWSM